MMLYDINGNYLPTPGAVNVKDFGAKGDGTTNDATAIQSALDSLSTSGGIIFFPKGTYLLTSSIVFYSNQTLWFENATLLQGAAINNLLISKCASDVTGYNGTHDCLIYGATFDGGSYETNNTLAGIVHSKNIIFQNCTFKNAYGTWHNLEINSSYNCKVINCDFEGSRKTSENGCMIQVDSINSSSTWPWDGNRGQIDNTVSKHIEIYGCYFHNDTVSPAIGNHSSAIVEYIKIHDCLFVGLTTNRSAIDFQGSLYVDVYNNTFVNCDKIIGDRSGSLWTFHDNRVDGADSFSGTTASSLFAVKYNNFVEGVFYSGGPLTS